MDIITLVIMLLATWRLASLLADEHGPGLILERIRFFLGTHYLARDGEVVKTYPQFSALSESDQAACVRLANTELSKALTCVWCSSVWIAAVLVLLTYWLGPVAVWLMLPFAVSAGAIMLNRIINGAS